MLSPYIWLQNVLFKVVSLNYIYSLSSKILKRVRTTNMVPSVCTHYTTGEMLGGFLWNLVLLTTICQFQF